MKLSRSRLCNAVRAVVHADARASWEPLFGFIGPTPNGDSVIELEETVSILFDRVKERGRIEEVRSFGRAWREGGDCEDLNLVVCGGYVHYMWDVPCVAAFYGPRDEHVNLYVPAIGAFVDVFPEKDQLGRPRYMERLF